MRTRWSAYAGVSAALAGGVIVKALAQRPNFYSATVYLSQSSANLMILTNFVFVTACTLVLGLQKLLYGPLRPIEIEQLYEKAWFAVTETCLAMTIFRGEIGAWFLVMFFALLAGKVWAWIGEGRVEILEQQPPRNPRLFHTRLALSLGLSVMFDLTMLEYVVKQVMHMARPDMMVMFGFEFAVLSIVSLSTASRYAINLAEIAIVRSQKARRIDEIRRERISAAVREAEQAAQAAQAAQGASEAQVRESTDQATADSTSTATPDVTSVPLQAVEAARRALQQPIDESEIEVEGWEGKGRWIFYLDLTTDFFKLVVYLSFFFILLIFYGLPIHILRDVFMTFRSFFKRIGDFLRYRTATRDMNARYPDATEQDIGSEDVCIICREEMRPYQPPANGERANPVAERMRPKKLPCGHILHFSCLRSWLERQQICPTCRTTVVARTSPRAGANNAADGAAVQHGNAGPAERQGPRIYQWGPLRIGIGAARGNMLEDLQQQLVDGQPRQGQQPQVDGPQQYGFGIRWDGLRRRDRDRDRSRGDRGTRGIQRQLDDVQRQISQEYRALGQMTNELRLLRSMEAELTRIRAQRQGGTFPATGTLPGAAAVLPGSTLPTITALSGNVQNTIPAGSDQLPAGLALPEGWSMMPLQPGPQPMTGQNFPGVLMQSGIIPFNPAAGVQSGFMPAPGFVPANSIPAFPGNLQNHNTTTPSNARQATQRVQAPSGAAGVSMNGILPRPGLPGQTSGNRNAIETNGSINTLPQAQNTQTNTNALSSPDSDSENGVLPSVSKPASVTNQSNPTGARQDTISTAQSTADGIDDPRVASMFTLPSWGSVPMEASTSTRATNVSGRFNAEHEQPNATPASDDNSTDQGQIDAPSSSARKDKNPTVEDLVEEPD